MSPREKKSVKIKSNTFSMTRYPSLATPSKIHDRIVESRMFQKLFPTESETIYRL